MRPCLWLAQTATRRSLLRSQLKPQASNGAAAVSFALQLDAAASPSVLTIATISCTHAPIVTLSWERTQSNDSLSNGFISYNDYPALILIEEIKVYFVLLYLIQVYFHIFFF